MKKDFKQSILKKGKTKNNHYFLVKEMKNSIKGIDKVPIVLDFEEIKNKIVGYADDFTYDKGVLYCIAHIKNLKNRTALAPGFICNELEERKGLLVPKGIKLKSIGLVNEPTQEVMYIK